MTKDEALAFDLALEALRPFSTPNWAGTGVDKVNEAITAITAIKQARALDKMAENARELGLDYDPAGGTQVSKVWWDGEKLMAKPIPLEDIYQPTPVQEPVAQDVQEKCRIEVVSAKGGLLPAAPVQEPVAWWNGEYGSPVFAFKRDTPGIGLGNPDATPLYTTPPAAQRQWVGLTDEEITDLYFDGFSISELTEFARAIEAKLKEKNT